jgi:hypothetical protein
MKMETNDEIKQQESEQEVRQATAQDPPEETVGDIMNKASGEGLKFWVIAVSVIVYLAGIVYAEVHGLSMLQKGVAPDMRIWATLGMIAAGITAVALPLALKVWTIEAKQRIAAYAFYLLDFGFLVFNAFTDFNTNAGQQLAGWAQTYVSYVLPSSPVIVAAGWALIWELDPGVRQKILQLTLRAAMKEKMARKVADAAKGAKVTQTVNAAAEREVERALTELFGMPVRTVAGYVMDEPKRGGWLTSFFDFWSRLGQRTSSPDTASQSQPQPSPVPAPEDHQEPKEQ